MGNTSARLVLAVAAALMLAACGSDYYIGKPKNVDPNIFPAEYKKEITDLLTTTLEDPTNVRDAFITDPALISTGKDQRYRVCVRYNGRNANRHYKGSVDRIAYFYGGRLNQLIDATKEQCGNAPYKPFPELEKLCLAKKCE
jgi:hypothetical protein